MPATIVVGFDGTRQGRAAVAAAIRLGRREGAEVVIACTHPRPLDPNLHPYTGAQIEPGTWPREWAEGRAHEMQHEALRVRLAGLEGRPACSPKDPHEFLIDVARAEGASSIVVCDDRRGRLHDRLFGSTTRRLLKASRVPVLVVSPDGPDDD
jgi:nucleotide-binding universal stress UspA family protein